MTLYVVDRLLYTSILSCDAMTADYENRDIAYHAYDIIAFNSKKAFAKVPLTDY